MTKDEALKLALEALEYIHEGANNQGPHTGISWRCVSVKAKPAITAIKQALVAPLQEPWIPSDTAYRPDGLPQDFIKHEVDSASDWSEWVCPDPTQYFMKCCDCGLVHEMQFNIVKYSDGNKCEDFDDPYVQAVFRARRVTPPAAQREWVGLTDEEVMNFYLFWVVDLQDIIGFYKVVDRKLKEKNT
jgi:hypothetical protein